MSIWGKIVGGAAGFALGGPIGAFLGAMAGHAVDRMRSETEEEGTDSTKQITFTIGVIVLGAKMAKADGVVTKDEVAAFKQVFRIPPEEMKNVGRLFDRARQDAEGFEPYANQIGRTFKDNPAVLEELLNGLFHIAKADGNVSSEEVVFLQRVAEIFGFSETQWDRLHASNVGPDKSDPYKILGITRESSDQEIKSAHRKLVIENHPDKLVAQGMPQEFVDLANEKLAAINAAYDQIKQLRS
ncbi:TerB family tellurite resistance protein [Kiloniella majae]|uniref:TerB family tellurite resistance protein n=1 Tax=Kiloniella majae TaxID=1938558 RepID=UPI000A277FE5|nr:TerB family tellurite resistance protein [Kiloniella majae]